MRNLMPILLILVSVGLFYLHIDPRYETIRSLQDEKGQYEDALEKAKELEEVRDNLLTKYNTLPKDDLIRLERLIPTNLNTVKLIADLSAVAGPYGAALKNITVTEAVGDNAQEVLAGGTRRPYETTTIALKFSATYEKMTAFLKDIEKSLQLVDVKSVAFESKDTASGIYDYSVTVQTYWLK